MKRYVLFAAFAAVAVLAATVAPEAYAAYTDPGVLLLSVALAGAGFIGDIQFVTSKTLREGRANLVDTNQKLLAKIGAEKDAARVKELEAEWDQRDIANKFATALATTNPRFNRKRFLTACGID